jgi:hypothetical protein
VPRDSPLSRAFVSRTLLGVVVPGPGVPGRRERAWGFSVPIPREGPGGLTLGVAGAAGLTRETLHVEPAPPPFSAGCGARARATGGFRSG